MMIPMGKPKPKEALPYMNVTELATFKRLRDNGQISVFRTTTCGGTRLVDDVPTRCDVEIHSDRVACSLKCYESMNPGGSDGDEEGNG